MNELGSRPKDLVFNTRDPNDLTKKDAQQRSTRQIDRICTVEGLSHLMREIRCLDRWAVPDRLNEEGTRRIKLFFLIRLGPY